jgi:integral membrane protein (TIGR01906 family)
MLNRLRNLQRKIKQKLRRQSAYIWTISFFLVLIIILSNLLFMFYNTGFYYSEYQKLSVYNEIPKEKAAGATVSMLDYLTGKNPELSSFFNEREKLHLKDVRTLVIYSKIIVLIIILIIAFLSYLLYKKLKTAKTTNFRKYLIRKIADIFVLQSILMAAFLVLSFLLRKAFGFFFVLFHKIMFNNDFWLLDPNTDKLIVLLPEQFFIHATAAILIRSLLICTVLLILGLAIRYLANKK